MLLDLYSCFLIPAYTLLYAGGSRWFSTNFSVLAAGTVWRFFGCLSWGVLTGLYYLIMVRRIGRRLERSRLIDGLTAVACVTLVAALLLPYAPERLPRQAQMHVILAFSACVLMMLVLLLILLQLRGRLPGWGRLFRWWCTIAAVSLLLLAAAGKVTSVLEIWFVITTAQLVRAIWLHRTAEREIS